MEVYKQRLNFLIKHGYRRSLQDFCINPNCEREWYCDSEEVWSEYLEHCRDMGHLLATMISHEESSPQMDFINDIVNECVAEVITDKVIEHMDSEEYEWYLMATQKTDYIRSCNPFKDKKGSYDIFDAIISKVEKNSIKMYYCNK